MRSVAGLADSSVGNDNPLPPLFAACGLYPMCYIQGTMEMPISSPAMKAFRRNLLQILEDKNLSLSWLSEETGIARPFLSRVVNGHSVCTIPKAEEIARALKVPLHSLLGPEKISA